MSTYGWVLPNGTKHERPWSADYDEREDTHDTMAHELGYTNPGNVYGSSIRHALDDGAVRFIRHRDGMELEFRHDHDAAKKNAIALLTKHKPNTVWMDHPGRVSTVKTTYQAAIGRLGGLSAEPKTDVARARQFQFGGTESVQDPNRLQTRSAGWLAPDGTHHVLEPGEQHHDWTARHFGLTKDSWDSVDKAFALLDSGWIRKGDKDAYTTHSPKQHLPRILKHVRRYHPDVDTIHIDYPNPDRQSKNKVASAVVSVARPFHVFNGVESIAIVTDMRSSGIRFHGKRPSRSRIDSVPTRIIKNESVADALIAMKLMEGTTSVPDERDSWIHPNGDEYHLEGSQHHAEWAYDNADMVNATIKDSQHHLLGDEDPDDDSTTVNTREAMIKHGGWIRQGGGGYWYEARRQDLPKIRAHLLSKHPHRTESAVDLHDRDGHVTSYKYDVQDNRLRPH